MSEANTICVFPAMPSYTPASLFFFRASVPSVANLLLTYCKPLPKPSSQPDTLQLISY